MSQKYARVYLLDVPYAIDHVFVYFLPPDMRERVERGSFVCSNKGRRNRLSK